MVSDGDKADALDEDHLRGVAASCDIFLDLLLCLGDLLLCSLGIDVDVL